MKKVCACLLLVFGALAWLNQDASALPPFNKEWMAKYKDGNSNAKFVEAVDTAKCNVCHMGASKKDKNVYGKAVGKYLTKAKYNELKENEEAGRKYILDGLQKSEGEKGPSGKTFGEMIKAGQLPGG